MNQPQPPRVSAWKPGTIGKAVIAIEEIFVAVGKDQAGQIQWSKEPIERRMHTREMIDSRKNEIKKQYEMAINFWDKGLAIFDDKAKSKKKK